MGDARYFSQLPDHRLQRAIKASAQKRRERLGERESMLERVVTLTNKKIEVLIDEIRAYRKDNYPEGGYITKRVITGYLADKEWVWDTNAVVDYLYAEIVSAGSKAGWKKRHEREAKNAAKDTVRVPLLSATGARVILNLKKMREERAKRAEKRKTRKAAKKIADAKVEEAHAAFYKNQDFLI